MVTQILKYLCRRKTRNLQNRYQKSSSIRLPRSDSTGNEREMPKKEKNQKESNRCRNLRNVPERNQIFGRKIQRHSLWKKS